jgi:hypothetical protein
MNKLESKSVESKEHGAMLKKGKEERRIASGEKRKKAGCAREYGRLCVLKKNK